jgi:adenosylmethionine-8-amino-7-oxononanoate aminotransferase
VHLILDEIAVGCGRTGTFFACEQAGIWPDFLCLSKGISGGYLPLSLVMTRDEIYQAFYSKTSRAASCTRTRTPATRWPAAPRWRRCRSSRKTTCLTPTASGRASDRRAATAGAARARAQLPPARHDLGLRRHRCAPDFSRRFFATAVEHELLLRPIGRTVYMMPPYVLDDGEIDGLAAARWQCSTK